MKRRGDVRHGVCRQTHIQPLLSPGHMPCSSHCPSKDLSFQVSKMRYHQFHDAGLSRGLKEVTGCVWA